MRAILFSTLFFIGIGTLSIPTLLASRAAADCPIAFTEQNLCAQMQFLQKPNIKNDSRFVLQFWSAQDAEKKLLLPPYQVTLKIWMDMGHGHGHGSAPLKIQQREDTFDYLVSNVWFVMPGNWQVQMQLLHPEDGAAATDKKTIPVCVSDPRGSTSGEGTVCIE